MVVVADTSPLTALLHLNLINLLPALYGKVYIPQAVAEEIKSLIGFGYDISFLNQSDLFDVKRPADGFIHEEWYNILDIGEAEAIALALELNVDLLLIDEKLGKQLAEEKKIVCKGVVGVLIEAKLKGLIKEIKPLLNELTSGLKFRLSGKIIALALQRAGE